MNSIRILLIEDNFSNRILMADYLNWCGYQVYALPDASNFSEAMNQLHPHLILLDLKLPGINGFMVLKHIQQQAEWCSIPVIVVSALVFEQDQQQALQLGARRFMTKPVRLELLRQAIEEEVHGR